jgi:hypothetical protein
MDIGLAAIAFGIIMLGVIKVYGTLKKDLPRPFLWLMIAAILAISFYLAMTRGCTPDWIV